MTPFKKLICYTWIMLQIFLGHCEQKKPKVIIIGAGVAGIAAGCRLLQNGIDDVIVLEAENRIGGRIKTVQFDGATLELGSSLLIMDENDGIFNLVQNFSQMKLTELNMTQSEYVEANGNVISSEQSFEIQNIFDTVLGDFEAMDNFKLSLGKFLNQSLFESEDYEKVDKQLGEKFKSWYIKSEISSMGVNFIHRIPAKVYSEYWKTKSNNFWVFDHPGMKLLLDALMNKFSTTNKPYPLEEKILLNKEVTNINWSTDNKTNVVVTCSDGSQYTADHVITTVSLGVLKERADTLFTPNLPESKKKAIKYIGYGSNVVLYFKFSRRWWPENFDGFSFLWSKNFTDELYKAYGDQHESKQWISSIYGFYPIDFHDNILEVFFSGKYSKIVENLTDDELKTGAMDALKIFVGKRYTIPEPVGILREYWYPNPHFRGAYSYISSDTLRHKTGPSELEKSLNDGANRPLVIFSGEATSSNNYATIHGAIQSGWTAADSVLEVYD